MPFVNFYKSCTSVFEEAEVDYTTHHSISFFWKKKKKKKKKKIEGLSGKYHVWPFELETKMLWAVEHLQKMYKIYVENQW